MVTASLYAGNVSVYSHVAPDRYLAMKLNHSESLALRWFRDGLCEPQVHQSAQSNQNAYYQACKGGWTRTMQGRADLVRQCPDQLSHSSRWLCRTADPDAFGVESCTAELEGYLSEREKGNVLTLKGGEKITAEFKIGVLEPPAAQIDEEIIATSVAGKSQ